MLQYCFCFYVLISWPQGMWDLSSPTRERATMLCFGRLIPNLWTARKVLWRISTFIIPLSAKFFKKQPFHRAPATLHHSLGAISLGPEEGPSPQSTDLLFKANMCLWLSATLSFHRYLLWPTICSSVLWMRMCIKVLLIAMPWTSVPHRSGDIGVEDKSMDAAVDTPGGKHRVLAVWTWAS